MLYKVILAVVDYGPQHRSFGMSAYYFMQAGGKSVFNNVQVGGASNSEAGEKSASMNIIKKLGNKMLPNFIFKIINPI
ncbi:hypothetical protein N2034_06590 [Staphylococcus aureus]|uniref:hypothetical protein n=2 Tax=Staphylococcus TaxID=1279 RepID=UPI001953711C|nr:MULTISPECIES: hypothetical protein [Staphylococcus]MCT2554293.1 hypothetical protein [Staphylococcus aureus]MCT2555876.1 hypothetical protein [Staphylococcus aureus]MEA1240871.1 hypothetical protein [Staphylococcus aureus]MEA3594627.1 hypothetical protein [Staphylococcus aureus]HDX7794629.1 hypothetical protein [Staphylococcus aureus]